MMTALDMIIESDYVKLESETIEDLDVLKAT